MDKEWSKAAGAWPMLAITLGAAMFLKKQQRRKYAEGQGSNCSLGNESMRSNSTQAGFHFRYLMLSICVPCKLINQILKERYGRLLCLADCCAWQTTVSGRKHVDAHQSHPLHTLHHHHPVKGKNDQLWYFGKHQHNHHTPLRLHLMLSGCIMFTCNSSCHALHTQFWPLSIFDLFQPCNKGLQLNLQLTPTIKQGLSFVATTHVCIRWA